MFAELGIAIVADVVSVIVAAQVATGGIALDGRLDDWVDVRGDPVKFHLVTPSTGVIDNASKPFDDDADSDLSFAFAVAYDEDAMYVAAVVRDDKLVTDSCEVGDISAPAWDDDAIEVFIDGNCNRSPDSRGNGGAELAYGGEFSIVANGAATSDFSGFKRTFGKLWNGATNYERVKAGEDKCMVYEFRLPWAVMGCGQGETKIGGEIGFNISAQDDDDGGRRDHALYWLGDAERPFSDESAFGTVRFGQGAKRAK